MQIKANTAELITQISNSYFFLDQLRSLGYDYNGNILS